VLYCTVIKMLVSGVLLSFLSLPAPLPYSHTVPLPLHHSLTVPLPSLPLDRCLTAPLPISPCILTATLTLRHNRNATPPHIFCITASLPHRPTALESWPHFAQPPDSSCITAPLSHLPTAPAL
jgi:hypothetical protein